MCLPFMHKWKVQRAETMKTFENTHPRPGQLPVEVFRYVELICEKCGDVKAKKFQL